MERRGTYKDGGTVRYCYKGIDYTLDKRIATNTYDQWYVGYPKNDNSNILTDKVIIDQLNNGVIANAQYHFLQSIVEVKDESEEFIKKQPSEDLESAKQTGVNLLKC